MGARRHKLGSMPSEVYWQILLRCKQISGRPQIFERVRKLRRFRRSRYNSLRFAFFFFLLREVYGWFVV